MHRRLAFVAILMGVALFCSAAFAQSASPPPRVIDLATRHQEVPKVACGGCHEKEPTTLSAEDALANVNGSCIECHGDAKAVAAEIAPKLAHKEINPHASHLVQIDCVICHKGHTTAAEAYCLQCHAFDMPMPPKTAKK